MDNYLTNIVGKGMIFPIQLTRNENGETGWYPVNGDMALVRNNISSNVLFNRTTISTGKLWESPMGMYRRAKYTSPKFYY